jgi:hypothetical protein
MPPVKTGKRTVRDAEREAGLGERSKRRLLWKGAERECAPARRLTSSRIRRASVQISAWSLRTRP